MSDPKVSGSVAPTVEHSPRKVVVVGSSPTRASIDAEAADCAARLRGGEVNNETMWGTKTHYTKA